MVDLTRNWNVDPRFRSSGALGSEEWASEQEMATGGFMDRPSMCWKRVLVYVAVIAVVCLLIYAAATVLVEPPK